MRGTGAAVSANLGGSSKDFWRDLYTWRREVDQGSMSTEFEHGSVGPKPAVKAVKHCCLLVRHTTCLCLVVCAFVKSSSNSWRSWSC